MPHSYPLLAKRDLGKPSSKTLILPSREAFKYQVGYGLLHMPHKSRILCREWWQRCRWNKTIWWAKMVLREEFRSSTFAPCSCILSLMSNYHDILDLWFNSITHRLFLKESLQKKSGPSSSVQVWTSQLLLQVNGFCTGKTQVGSPSELFSY